MNFLGQIVNSFKKESEECAYYRVWSDLRDFCNNLNAGLTSFDINKVNGYAVVFDNQKELVDNNIVERIYSDRYDVSTNFKSWLEMNLEGFYKIWRYGNGTSNNIHQFDYGIWRIEVICMRKSDALSVWMKWT